MTIRRIGVLVLTASRIAAAMQSSAFFSGTSPFYLFSSSPLPSAQLDNLHVSLAEDIQSAVPDMLSACPSSTYVVVRQPGVHASDYEEQLSAPHLQRWLPKGSKRTVSSVAIPQVLGQVDARSISEALAKKCKATAMKVDAASGHISMKDVFPRVVTVDFPSLPVDDERESALAAHDSFLNEILSGLRGDAGYTVIYTTSALSGKASTKSPHPVDSYEMDDLYPSSLHLDLKRDLVSREGNKVLDSNLPLFEKYQFLTPALFMGFLVFFFLFVILYVGLSALSNIQVSYFAFSKEMGPTAQKKQ